MILHNYIQRAISSEVSLSAAEYPAVTLIGPRQSGKTTLVRHLFPDHAYVNLEDPQLRNLAEQDPKALLSRFAPPVIFDEVQRVPDLLSYLQVQIDEAPGGKGQWILTGSNQLKLRESVSQSLAGRTALLTLLPLSISELKAAGQTCPASAGEWIHRGFLPRIHQENIRPLRAWRDYYQTYVERDVRLLL